MLYSQPLRPTQPPTFSRTWIPAKEQWCAAGKVIVGLMSHWPCVTWFCGKSTNGFNGVSKGRTPLVQLVVHLFWSCCTTSCRILWNVADLLHSCSICCTFVVVLLWGRFVVQHLDVSICCGFCCTACCTTNSQLIEQVEFGLKGDKHPDYTPLKPWFHDKIKLF